MNASSVIRARRACGSSANRAQMRRRRTAAGSGTRRPADEGERDRRNVPDDEAAEHGIAGPEQRRQRQQQIRLVEQPARARRRERQTSAPRMNARSPDCRMKSRAAVCAVRAIADAAGDYQCARRMTGPALAELRQSARVQPQARRLGADLSINFCEFNSLMR